jgi:hypothetical protein
MPHSRRPTGYRSTAAKRLQPPLQWDFVIKRHLIVTMNGPHNLPFAFVGGWGGAGTTLATSRTSAQDLHSLGLVPSLDGGNADVVHRRHRHQQQHPCHLVQAERLAGCWRVDEVARSRIRAQLP